MIYDTLQNLSRYETLSSDFATAVQYLRATDLFQLPYGCTGIAGDRVFLNRFDYTTAVRAPKALFEAHERYLDLHIVLNGQEGIALAPTELLTEWKHEEDDSILYTGDEAYRLSLRVGQFALLYPGEGHMPKLVCGIPSHVDKIVVKLAITRYLIDKGVNGLYVGGSSGECIYHSVAERKIVLENVMVEAAGKITVIAHVACNNTADSQDLAAHAESVHVDAIAAIPPIYFHLPPYAIADYWNDISAAAPNTDFIIYNIPQLAGVALTMPLLKEMRKNPRVIGVKNSSAATQDIQMWKDEGGADFVVMNGPDEQFVSGLAMGATGGIGGTYAVMPELFIKARKLFYDGKVKDAYLVQNEICRIIYKICEAHGNLYAVQKSILARKGIFCGGVRKPLPALIESDLPIVNEAAAMIDAAIEKYC